MTIDTSPDALERLATAEILLVPHDETVAYVLSARRTLLAIAAEKRAAPTPDELAQRFLRWKLPQDFSPDCGISFKKSYNEDTPWPGVHEPTGTNLLTYEQAKEMARFMLSAGPEGV